MATATNVDGGSNPWNAPSFLMMLYISPKQAKHTHTSLQYATDKHKHLVHMYLSCWSPLDEYTQSPITYPDLSFSTKPPTFVSHAGLKKKNNTHIMNNKHVETIYLMMIAWNGIKLEEKKDCAPTPDLPPVARSPQTLIDYIARSFFFCLISCEKLCVSRWTRQHLFTFSHFLPLWQCKKVSIEKLHVISSSYMASKK